MNRELSEEQITILRSIVEQYRESSRRALESHFATGVFTTGGLEGYINNPSNNTINYNNNMEEEERNLNESAVAQETAQEEVDPFEPAQPGDSVSPELGREFFESIGGTTEGSPRAELDPNDLVQTLSREISVSELVAKLQQSRQNRVMVKEVVIQEDPQIVRTIQRMRSNYIEQMDTALRRMNDLYVSKVEEVNKMYREAVVGEKLINLINRLNGWQLVIKPNFVHLCKFYAPPKPVTISVSEGYGTTIEYEEPICHIKAIYVNLLHSKITRGTIKLSTIKQHPNVSENGLGTACVGELEDREITMNDPDNLIILLKEIETTYERIHSDSAYYNPQNDHGNDRNKLSNVPFIKVEGKKQWTA